MTIDKDDLINSILAGISGIDYVRSADIPNIDLYMDQVTSFMEKALQSTKRYEEDKILTKTMINNYAKNDLLPPPVKKKYSREHLLVLTFIYYFKSFLSIGDIEKLMAPVTEKYFQAKEGVNVSQIYDEICSFARTRIQNLKDNIRSDFESCGKTFLDTGTEDLAFLQLFAFICELSIDVYIKKMVVEKLIDTMIAEKTEEREKEKEKPEKAENPEKKSKKDRE